LELSHLECKDLPKLDGLPAQPVIMPEIDQQKEGFISYAERHKL